jgi:hypothetical protein
MELCSSDGTATPASLQTDQKHNDVRIFCLSAMNSVFTTTSTVFMLTASLPSQDMVQ